LYLQAFVGDVPWAHLDIAGPARSTVNAGLRQLGATGFGVELLRRWLADGPRY
jgi:leucyl aminopeptidase